MPDSLFNPTLALKAGEPVPSIEVDNDEISGQYASGAWEGLLPEFTASWVKQKKFAKPATIWTWGSQSVSFHHLGFSVFIAQFGLPMSYFEALERHLASKLHEKVRFSDYVQPSRSAGWRARVHVQDGATWVLADAYEWSKVGA